MPLPEHRNGVRAVTAGALAEGDHDRPPVRHALDLALEDWPPCHAGSLRIASMITRRHARLRPEIRVGRLASGIRASMNSGCSSPQSQVCMPPIEVPMTRRA